MNFTAGDFVAILTMIGLLALIVSVITEVTKDVILLKKIPTNIQVIVLSLSLTLVAYFAYISYSGTAIIWYYVVADVIAGFIVAYVVLYGWGKFTDLYKRFRNLPPLDISVNRASDIKSVASADTTNSSSDKNPTISIAGSVLPVSLTADIAVPSIAVNSKTDAMATDITVADTPAANSAKEEVLATDGAMADT